MIGIIGAMAEEVLELREEMKQYELTEKAGMQFYSGILKGQEVVVVQSGIGKVNGAVCAQILVDLFSVDSIINTGIAGGLNPAIHIGDLVISRDALQHDMDASAFGYPPGQIPRMDTFAFPADAELAEKAILANLKANPGVTHFLGRVVSGDEFVASGEKKEELRTVFRGECTEMEGAAIAQTAYLNRIPYVIIRAISDQADQSAGMDYPAFEKLAIERSVKLVLALLELL